MKEFNSVLFVSMKYFLTFFFFVSYLGFSSSKSDLTSGSSWKLGAAKFLILSLVLPSLGNHHWSLFPSWHLWNPFQHSRDGCAPVWCLSSQGLLYIARGGHSYVPAVPVQWCQQTAVPWKLEGFLPAMYRFPKSSLRTGPDQLRSVGHAIRLKWI